VERETGRPLPPVGVIEAAPPARAPFRVIWSRRYRGRTLLLTAFQLLQPVGYYGFMHYLGRLLGAKGFGHDEVLNMQLAASLLAPVGPLLGVWSSDRWQRKGLISALALGLAGLLLVFGLAGSAAVLVPAAALVVVGNNWFSVVFHAYQAELFPTEARATGIGFTYAWSRASMVAVSLVMPGLIATNVPAAFGLMIVAFVGVAVLIGAFGPRTNARPLEAVSG
jgi:putative MFS transporter